MAKNSSPTVDETDTSVRQRKTTNGLHVSPSEVKFHSMTETLEAERKEREKIVLWRRPVLTLQYFVYETVTLTSVLANR